jgi:hypothetical protein
MKLNFLKKTILNFSIFPVILVFFLLLIEGVLIFYSTEEQDNYGFTTEFKKKYIQYNKYGYRDYEDNRKKKQGVFRIIVLGDSQTFGHGIKDLNSTWVKKLEKKLIESIGNTNIEVLSISGPGWNSDTHLYELFKNGFKFNPDLVILAYYHNDIPFPISLNCDSSDRKIIPNINIFQSSKLVSFINFRINRLLEKIGDKPRYSDCLNQAYDSIGWEMNKFYLDIMGLSLSIKKIHFMLTVIPLIHQLDSNYPLPGPHKKLKEFAIKRNIEFLDFYEEGFKNLNPSNLKISKTDHHLNKNAGDIMSAVLFEKIKGLIKYKNLSYFNKAFTLKDILNENPLLIKLDSLINKQNSINTFILNSETIGLQITRSSTQLIINKLQKGKNRSSPISLTETKLSLSGDYIYHEKVTFHPNSKLPNLKESISNKSGVFIKTIEQIQPDTKAGLVSLKLGQREFQFDFEGDENNKRIKLEKDITFPDPKVLDKWVFHNYHPPSEEYSRKELIQKLVVMTNKNPKIYGMSDDIKIINQTDYFENLSNETISQKYDERILFQTFLIFVRYGAKDYVDLLIKLIEKSKPSLMSVKAADRYRQFFLSPNSD